MSAVNDHTPIPERQLLIDTAIEIDPALETSKQGSYSAVTWSNRLGTVLTPASVPGVYVACRPFYWNSIDVGGRMTVIQLQNSQAKNDLWIHSPVALDDTLRAALDRLGTVRHVVSPNYEHVKYAAQWADAFPQASIWACPGLAEREPQVRWTGELPFACRPPGFRATNDPWKGVPVGSSTQTPPLWDMAQIQPLHIDCELNPFTKRPFFNEVVFYHAPSKTFIATDVFWNYPTRDGIPNSQLNGDDFGAWELAPRVDQVPLTSRLWKFGMDRIYAPFYRNIMITSDREQDFQTITKHICYQWDIETIVPAHGDIIRGKKLIQNLLSDFFRIQKD